MPTVDEHFAGKADELRALYDRLVDLAETFGPVEQEPKKTSIHLSRTTPSPAWPFGRGTLF
jgi:hypothetical protein